MQKSTLVKSSLALCLLAWAMASCDREPHGLTNETKAIPPLEVSRAPAPPAKTPEGMVLIPAGSFLMGEEDSTKPHIGPIHKVTLKGFWMDVTEVTNAQFKAFVEATKHVTQAERMPTAEEFPDADPALLKPGANHFVGTTEPVETFTPQAEMQWWEYKVGANWRHPEGPESTIEDKLDFPVVCISWDDATAYSKWAGKRLPTEAEWEYAARGGLEQQPFVWGKEMNPDGKWLCNIWQGDFPNANSSADGFRGLAPVKSYAPNGYGLYQMAGNAWEWVNDWFAPDYYSRSPDSNPPGSAPVPDQLHGNNVPCKVIRGGSWLCNDCYCSGYRPGARQWTTPDTSANHTGFRCVMDL
jgi:sulfatase modifying factor 1